MHAYFYLQKDFNTTSNIKTVCLCFFFFFVCLFFIHEKVPPCILLAILYQICFLLHDIIVIKYSIDLKLIFLLKER